MRRGCSRAFEAAIGGPPVRAPHVHFPGAETRTRIPPDGTRVVTILKLN